MKRFFAGLVCASMLLCGGGGALAFAEETVAPMAIITSEPTVASAIQVTSDVTVAPTEQATSAPEPTAVPTEAPTAAPTEVATQEPTQAPTDVPTAEPTATAVMPPSATAAPTEPATAAPTATVTPQPTEAVTPVPTAAATEAPAISTRYAYVTGNAYEDAHRSTLLGSFAAKTMVYLDEQVNEDTWRVFFDTDVTRKTDEYVRAYVPVRALIPMLETEVEAALPGMVSVRSVGGSPLLLADFVYAAEPTEEPTEEPTVESTETASTEPTEAPTEAPTAEPSAEPTEVPAVEPTGNLMSESLQEPTKVVSLPPVPVSVHTNGDGLLDLGDPITLRADLSAYEGMAYTCMWQYAPVDAQGNRLGDWQDTGATGAEYTYTLTADNLLTAWRLHVTVTP